MASNLIAHKQKMLTGFVGTPSSSTCPWVNLANYNHVAIVISVANGSTVTGSAIGLQQATDGAGTGAKAVAFTKALRSLDQAASDLLTEFAVSSNTFTTDTTNSKRLLYLIEIDATELDVNGEFDWLKVTIGNAANTNLSVLYLLSEGRHGGQVKLLPSVLS